MNRFVDVAEIYIDHEAASIGVRFGRDGDVYVLPPLAAESLGWGLVDCARTFAPIAVTPAKWRRQR